VLVISFEYLYFFFFSSCLSLLAHFPASATQRRVVGSQCAWWCQCDVDARSQSAGLYHGHRRRSQCMDVFFFLLFFLKRIV
jgi:hypothetical protein